jgi:hypothetical protein
VVIARQGNNPNVLTEIVVLASLAALRRTSRWISSLRG